MCGPYVEGAQKRRPESKEAVAARQARYRERQDWTDTWLWITGQDNLPLAERRARIADWERGTGGKWITEAKRLALNAWYREVGQIRPWRYPLLLPDLFPPTNAEPRRPAQLAEMLAREHCGGAGIPSLMVELHCHRREWGNWDRYERPVRFKKEGVLRVPVARAAGPARPIRITAGRNRLYCGVYAAEEQRWHRRMPGDWTYKWDLPELSTWYCKVNRGFFKLPIPGNVDHPDDWWPCLDRRPRRIDPPLLFNQVLRSLDRDVEKECADDDCNVDGQRLSRRLPYDSQSRRVVVEFFNDDSIAVHWGCERYNRGRMRGNMPFNSTTKACSGIIGYLQPSPGWAARPSIHRDVALAALRLGVLPKVASIKAYWRRRLKQAVEIEARALSARCEALRPVRAFCEMMHRGENGWYADCPRFPTEVSFRQEIRHVDEI